MNNNCLLSNNNNQPCMVSGRQAPPHPLEDHHRCQTRINIFQETGSAAVSYVPTSARHFEARPAVKEDPREPVGGHTPISYILAEGMAANCRVHAHGRGNAASPSGRSCERRATIATAVIPPRCCWLLLFSVLLLAVGTGDAQNDDQSYAEDGTERGPNSKLAKKAEVCFPP